MTEADRIAKELRPTFRDDLPETQGKVANLALDFVVHLTNLLERLVVAREKEVEKTSN